jgi:6-phosphogluconate dehydrogenase
VIGLAVMGKNLAANMASKGFAVSVFNRSADKTKGFFCEYGDRGDVRAAYSLKELVSQLEPPRKAMLMVRAGDAVDGLIGELVPLLSPGDIVIDGGNSHFLDTERRAACLEKKGLLFVGAGISGGEAGALKGPSIMPGGSHGAWQHVKPVFQSVAAAAGGRPCCEWIGPGGAGHFVKMLHNGIEYADMQLICEAYQLMRDGLGMGPSDMGGVFSEWGGGRLGSYLLELTRDILTYEDRDGLPLVDKILDVAGQKGTGRWACGAALDTGCPLTVTGEAVFSRYLSAAREERIAASGIFTGPDRRAAGGRISTGSVRDALFASKIISYAQGFAMMRAVSAEYGWDLKYGDIALLWRSGCIIRSAFLGEIKGAFDRDAGVANILLDGYFSDAVEEAQKGWRDTCAFAIGHGIPVPGMASALSWFDGYRCASLPANLLQAQRDYFGAHTYERRDRPRGMSFHTDWAGGGEDAARRRGGP